jgi:hypothetical protein
MAVICFVPPLQSRNRQASFASTVPEAASSSKAYLTVAFLTVCWTLSRKSDTTAAVLYALNRWQALTPYCNNGAIEVDNSAAERALRTVALGRKNFLFAGADSGGERATAMYSLIGTARLNGMDPEAYLRYVLGRIAEHAINHINDLLPCNVAGCLLSFVANV